MPDTQLQGKIRLQVYTPSKKLIDAVSDEVSFPTTLGRVGILPGHTETMCELGTGVLYYAHDDMTGFAAISEGIAHVCGDQVVILADMAEDPASINLERAEQQLERARAQLSGIAASPQEAATNVKHVMQAAAQAEAKAIARIEAFTSHATKK